MKVKICGITRVDDALAAADAGAAAVGFIFTASSKRRIGAREAARIIAELPPSVTPVGVVADMPREALLELLRLTGVRAIQFHGEESPEALLGFPVPVYKSIAVGATFDPSIVGTYPGEVVLLDTLVEGTRGGTGVSFDWSIAARLVRERKIILAGGIRADSVTRVVEQVGPWAIDLCSGVESAPGIKDHFKINALFAAVRAAGAEETGCLF